VTASKKPHQNYKPHACTPFQQNSSELGKPKWGGVALQLEYNLMGAWLAKMTSMFFSSYGSHYSYFVNEVGSVSTHLFL